MLRRGGIGKEMKIERVVQGSSLCAAHFEAMKRFFGNGSKSNLDYLRSDMVVWLPVDISCTRQAGRKSHFQLDCFLTASVENARPRSRPTQLCTKYVDTILLICQPDDRQTWRE